MRKVYLGIVHGEQECAALVKRKHPDAFGAIFVKSGPCYAQYGGTVSNVHNSTRYCELHTGNIIVHIKIFHVSSNVFVLWYLLQIYIRNCI